MRVSSPVEGPRQHTPSTGNDAGMEHAIRGGVRFVATRERAALQAPIEAASLLSVDVELPLSGGRGKLRQWIQRAIERALDGQKAPPREPTDVSEAALDAVLTAQLRRARQIGLHGVSLYIPHLGRIASPSGVLDLDDGAALRWWLQTACEGPVVVLLDDSDRALGAYGPPVPIEHWAATSRRALEASGASASVSELPAQEAPAVRPPRDTAEPTGLGSNEPRHGESTATSADPSVIGPSHLVGERAWKTWAEELDAARGPKPLATIERLFVADYVPLAQALVRGEGSASARATLASWATSFAKSYVEAFGALRITGKRPLMVLDVPQLASRVARLHGAKLTQLVLIDGMRFDLGLRVHERLRAELGAVGRCTERFLLWAALPTTTSAQLELLARGPEALAHRDVSNEREEAFGGRGASILRRVRVGARDLLKLDLVEARLREAGAPELERLDALAAEVACVVAAHAKSLAPRTLLFLFGDHGFQLDRTTAGTSTGRCGGASPEEVLVPAFTWLMGDVH